LENIGKYQRLIVTPLIVVVGVKNIDVFFLHHENKSKMASVWAKALHETFFEKIQTISA